MLPLALAGQSMVVVVRMHSDTGRMHIILLKNTTQLDNTTQHNTTQHNNTGRQCQCHGSEAQSRADMFGRNACLLRHNCA
jgi:hypothetical protein